MSQTATGVLVMAYGSPERLEDVEAYYTHIRRGRKPSPEQLGDLIARYERIGGSPLNAITHRVAEKLGAALNSAGGAYRAYVGMKHWHPYIADTVDKMAADGIERAVALVLTPQYSRLSVGEYLKTVQERAGAHGIAITGVESWYGRPEYIEFMAGRVRAALESFPPSERGSVEALYTAHSLPERILEWDDPYPKQLRETAALIDAQVKMKRWRFAYQSASKTHEPWLGPDILDALEELHRDGVRNVIVCPVGFVSDHLEVLYDIDVEAQARAAELGMKLVRTDSPNDHPDFVKALAAAVEAAAAKASAPQVAGSAAGERDQKERTR